MPALDQLQDAFDAQLDDENNDPSKQKNGKGKESSKVSHIPCKFFKAGACAAGQSCIFSHAAMEKGVKEPCTWFVKGNCKFGHKCALAHILPGQPMSMDRKNKKAAQLSNANARADKTPGKQARGGLSSQRDAQQEQEGSKSRSQRNNSKQLQGNISATAPPTSPRQPDYDSNDETPTTPTNLQQSNIPPAADESSRDSKNTASPGPALLSANAPPPGLQQRSTPHRFNNRNQSSDLGYGPIGSPPQAGIRPGVLSHFSPGTSPATKDPGLLSSSPFAQQTKPSVFGYGDRDLTGNRAAAISSSFADPITIANGSWRNPDNQASALADSDNDDMEGFLPSSLTDLLTPEEKQRRLSRSGGTRPGAELSHRYSRSVPAAGLLDNPNWMNNKDRNPEISTASMSFRSAFGSEGPSSLNLASSNASGAFLSHYRKPQQTQFTNPAVNRQPFSQSFGDDDRLLGLPTTTNAPSGISRLRGDVIPQPQPSMGSRLGGGGLDTLSPTSRALHYHAPGQSLPQGLAAGLSRLHLKPPSSQLGGLPEEGDRTRGYDPYIRSGTSPLASGGLLSSRGSLGESGTRRAWGTGGSGYEPSSTAPTRGTRPPPVAEDEDVFELDDEK